MNVMECAEAILETLDEDYPVELEELTRGAAGWSMSVTVGTGRVFLRVVDGRVVLSPQETRGTDIEVRLTRDLLFNILDGTARMEDAFQGDPEVIVFLSVVVEDFLGICHRSARIVGILNEFRYGRLEPIS